MEIIKNKKTFEVFFKENYSSLCRYAFNYLKDADEAEEEVQNCFIKLWEDREKKTINSSIKSYLYTSVKNACLNTIKHRGIKDKYRDYVQAQNVHYDDSENIENEKDLTILLSKAIDKMPEKRKEVFLMSRFEGLSYNEIAAHLSISVKTVENHMGSALKFLRLELKDYLHLYFVFFFLEEIGVLIKSIVL